MKSNNILSYLLILFMILGVSSCKDDEPTNTNTNTNNSALSGKWSLSEVDDGSGLEPVDEYFVWNLNSNGTGFSEYRSEGGPLVKFDLIWEVTSDNILRISQDGGQDWLEERILKQTSTELWTYDIFWEEELRYKKIP